MVPRLAAQGTSFQGAFQYYFHDKDALTQARIAWTETLNMMTDKVEKAWKVMAYTAKHQERLKEASGQRLSGAKLKKPVMAYSLSWHLEQKPDRETMMEAVRTSLDKLGLSEHEAIVACHIDEPQPHIHVVVNKVHPRTGMVAALKHTKRKLSDWARKFQEMEGTHYCPKREENYQKRKKGMTTTYGDPVIVRAWTNSRDAKGFADALEGEGYRLEQGRKRLIVIDRYGKAHNPIRHLKDENVRVKEFNTRMKNWNPELQKQAKAKKQETSYDEQKFQDRLVVFNERAVAAKQAQIDKQENEIKTLKIRFDEEASSKLKKLTAHYKIEERQKRIETLRLRIESAPRWQRWMNLLLRGQKNRRLLSQFEENQHKAVKKIAEVMDQATDQHQKILKARKQQHTSERSQLRKQLEQWRPTQQFKAATCKNAERKEIAPILRQSHEPSIGR